MMAPQLHAINMPSRGDSELTRVGHKLCSSRQRMSSEIHNVTGLLGGGSLEENGKVRGMSAEVWGAWIELGWGRGRWVDVLGS